MLAELAGLVASSCASGTKTEWMRLSGDIKDCKNVVEVCLQSYPPKCMKACLDESPRPSEGGGPPGYVEGDSSGALKTGNQDTSPIPHPTVDRCGADPCVFGISEAGTPTAVCYPPDCLLPQIGTRTRVAPIVKPSLAFREVFGDRTADPVAARRNLAHSRSMLNAAKADIDRLNRKLGTEDKAVLDEYLTGISALERRLAATGSCSGGNPPRDPPVDRPNYYEYAIDLPAHNRLMSDIIANAFVCDTTRVVVMHLRTHRLNPASIFGGNTTTPYSIWHNDIEHAEEGGQFGADRGDPAGIARRYDLYTAGCQAMVAQFAYLVRKLKDTPERDGNGSILDNTILVCTSEISYGSGHSTTKLPVIVAGRGGGAVRPGRYISVPRQPIANLWVSMLRAAGVRTSSGGEITSFGNSTESLALG